MAVMIQVRVKKVVVKMMTPSCLELLTVAGSQVLFGVGHISPICEVKLFIQLFLINKKVKSGDNYSMMVSFQGMDPSSTIDQ